ncbi:MAG: MFS transporter [Phycisphaerales bacterium]|nr:MFS transporter [Phycisphaerales bacterium]MCB9862230.1 MFS transporter [Phycisphaerales bacterium]
MPLPLPTSVSDSAADVKPRPPFLPMQQSSENRLLARAIIVSQFAPPFMFSGVAIALPTMGAELHSGGVALSLVETLFLAGSLSMLLPSGRLADAGDKRTLYKSGLLGFSLTSLLIGLMSSMPIIHCLRFLQGMSSAIYVATGPAILTDIVPVRHRGRAFGSSLGAIYAGLTLGPIVAGFLVDHFSWRGVFFFGAATLMAGYVLIRTMMPSMRDIPFRVLHWPSVVIVVAAVLSLVFGTSFVNEGAVGYALIGVGLVLSVIFAALQRRLDRPLLDVTALLANRVLRNALVVQMLVYMQAMASMFLLSMYLQVSRGVPADETGPVLAIGSIIMAVLAPFSGRLADRFRPSLLAGAGVLSILVTGLLAMTLGDETSLWFIRVMLVFQGLGFALFSSPNMTIIMNSVSMSSTSMASALAAKSRSLGMTTGMLIASLLISIRIGADRVQDHPEAMIGVVRTVFGILVAAVTLALALSILNRAKPAATAPASSR